MSNRHFIFWGKPQKQHQEARGPIQTAPSRRVSMNVLIIAPQFVHERRVLIKTVSKPHREDELSKSEKRPSVA